MRELVAAIGVGLIAYAAYRSFGSAPVSYSDAQAGALVDGSSSSSSSTSSQDLDTLARTIWGEARGAGYAAQVGVGSVIRNRVDDAAGRWPSTFDAVCKQPGQFDVWNPGDPNYAPMLAVDSSDSMFVQCQQIAAGIIDGSIADNTGGATNYFDDSIAAPAWAASMTPTVKIAALNFYRG